MSDFHYIIEDGKVTNPFEDYDAPTEGFPPYHWGQDWETFDANEWSASGMLDYTYQDEWHAVYTIQLGELVQSGTFDWSRDELDWSSAKYSDVQYNRLCAYFIERFRFREIATLPVLEWMYALRRMLMYELMPKYSPMYEAVEDGISALASENEYFKRRHIESNYPETLLSSNADYISTGDDLEEERIKIKNPGEALQNFKMNYESVDKALCDELEVLFISMYTSFVNGL